MSELITRTARLIPYSKRPKQVPSFVTAYLYEPEADEPTAELGNLYITIEVLVAGRTSEEVADLVIEAFSDHYYNQAQEKTPLERFESAIKATNHQLADFINQGNAAWIGKMSAIISVIAGSEIHLCQTGSGDAYLYRGRAHTRVISPSNKPALASKTFSSIASGELEAGDKLLFTTPALVHQIALPRLHNIIASHSPNTAIAELTAHLPATGSERIGVLVVEITTPELAALQIRSDEPSEIKLGQPESTFEAVKMAATPVAQQALTSGRKAHLVASSKANQLKPHIIKAGLAAVRFLREQVAGKRGGQRVLIGALIVIAAIIFIIGRSASSHELNALKSRYGKDYQLYLKALSQIEAKDTYSANASLETLQTDLQSIKANRAHKRLDAALAKEALPENEAKTVDAFIAQVGTAIDALHGLKRVSATTISTIGNTTGAHLETSGGNIYVISKDSIKIVNSSTKTTLTSKVSTSKLGQIAATTLSSSGDGVFILTNAPSVWFYRFDTDSLSELTLGGSPWEQGTAIASYTGNLYIMSDGNVYKHLKTITGYSPKSIALSKDNIPSLAGAKGLGIDGSVYTTVQNTLEIFLAGVAQPPLTLPSDLTSDPQIKSMPDYTLISDSSSKRIGLISTKSGAILEAEYDIKGIKSLREAAFDPTSKVIFALVDDKVVSFSAR